MAPEADTKIIFSFLSTHYRTVGGNSRSTIGSRRELALDSMFRFGLPKLDVNQVLTKQRKFP